MVLLLPERRADHNRLRTILSLLRPKPTAQSRFHAHHAEKIRRHVLRTQSSRLADPCPEGDAIAATQTNILEHVILLFPVHHFSDRRGLPHVGLGMFSLPDD